MMKVGIIGTRGIPNRYGGFEQLAEYLAVGLVQKGHAVTVYGGHDHPYQEKSYQGVELVHCRNPEKYWGSVGQFVYDWHCVRDARKRGFDVLLFLGYTSSSVWGRWYPKGVAIVTNMDGLEWQRSKYSRMAQWFLRHAEKWAIKHSHCLVADSLAIQQYLANKYKVDSTYIAYGAEIIINKELTILSTLGLEQGGYMMLMARMEPENNIAMILEGFTASNTACKLLVVGNMQNKYGQQLQDNYGNDKRIIFAGAIYNKVKLHTLKQQAVLYFHGHSAGGTNPSLLEAMASGVAIAAHDNVFNRAVLEQNAFYFNHAQGITQLIEQMPQSEVLEAMVQQNWIKVQQQYNWPLIIDQYEQLLERCCKTFAK
jgi:glycosyltransferase involved in cell wall biosynthesis